MTCSIRLCGIIGCAPSLLLTSFRTLPNTPFFFSSPGDRQVVPGFLNVLSSRQTIFQIGANRYLFDFVHVTNVVHAHILAASRLSSPPLPPTAFDERLSLVNSTVPRRVLPTSDHQNVSLPAPYEPIPLPAARSRFQQFNNQTSPVGVAGEAFYITNGEPVAFWSFARAVWFEYNGHVPPFTVKLPEGLGMFAAECAEFVGWLRGVAPMDCGLPKAHVQYVTSDMYCDIEKVRLRFRFVSGEECCADLLDWFPSFAGTSSARIRARHLARRRTQGCRGGMFGVPSAVQFCD